MIYTHLELPGLATRRFGRPIYHYADVASTQDLARHFALQGAKEGTSIFADRQHAGRGRQGRTWYSLAGDQFYLSVILRPPLPASSWAVINIAAGVALAEALDRMKLSGAQLKWPNDLYLDGKKAAGILSEVVGDMSALLLGVGINVTGDARSFPDEVRSVATTIEAHFGPMDRFDLLASFMTSFEERYDELMNNGSESLLKAFEALWIYRDRPIEVVGGGTKVTGTARSIEADGALLVETSEGLRRIVAGDVTLRVAREPKP